jgi:hypothetical protein
VILFIGEKSKTYPAFFLPLFLELPPININSGKQAQFPTSGHFGKEFIIWNHHKLWFIGFLLDYASSKNFSPSQE